MRVLLSLLFIALAPVATGAWEPVRATDRQPPNILLIVSDDHGWGDLPSNWDQTEVRLPTLDALAGQGVRFPNYHTVPLCGPSRACMFTGVGVQASVEIGLRSRGCVSLHLVLGEVDKDD